MATVSAIPVIAEMIVGCTIASRIADVFYERFFCNNNLSFLIITYF